MNSSQQSHSMSEHQQKPSAPDYSDVYNDEKPPPYHEAIKYCPPPYLAPSPSVAQPQVPRSSLPATVPNQRQVTAAIDPDMCPLCGGTLLTDFPSLCVILACLWFPIGVLFCLMSARKRCIDCRSTFDQ